MQIYLSEGALSSHDEEGVIGLLTMTLMAAVFNTQVSLSWILAHLYEDPELLATARDELSGCDDLEVRVSRAARPPPPRPRPRRRPPSSLAAELQRSWRCPSSTRASTRACGCTRCCRTPSSAAPPRSSPSTACRSCHPLPAAGSTRATPSPDPPHPASFPRSRPSPLPVFRSRRMLCSGSTPTPSTATSGTSRHLLRPYRLLKEGWGVDGAAPAVDGSLQPVGAARRAARRRALPRRGGGGGGGGQRGRGGRRRRRARGWRGWRSRRSSG